jgi:NADH:ubiquinone oxidoreductase subunit F (NADH-binding)
MFSKIVEGSYVGAKQRFELEELTTALALTSLCGHGSGLADFARSVLRHYQEELHSCFA